MNHLDSARAGQCFGSVPAARLTRQQNQRRADSFAGGEKGIVHRLTEQVRTAFVQLEIFSKLRIDLFDARLEKIA